MMCIEQFISSLSAKNIRLWIDGEKLRCDAPKTELTAQLRSELAERKGEIIHFLKGLHQGEERVVAKVNRSQDLELSFAQERLWFLDQLIPGNVAYNNSVAWRLKGEIDVIALKRSLQNLVDRHETLRTTFELKGDRPIQKIYTNVSLSFKEIDLSKENKEQQEELVSNMVVNEARTPMNLTEGPLFRGMLIKLQPYEHILMLNPHHIISDGWSWSVLFKELEAMYLSEIEGKALVLDSLEIQYADFAKWQKEYLQGEVLDQHLSYLRNKLFGAPALLGLPCDFQRPKLQTYNGKRKYIEIPKLHTKQLKKISIQKNVSLYMILLTFANLLFYAYTGSEDLCIGTPVASRNQKECESIFGFFVNTLVLRNQINKDMTFDELLIEVRETCLEAFEHQEIPFEKLVEELNVDRNTSYSPLVQTMFVLQDVKEADFKIKGIEVAPYVFDRKTSRFELEIYLWESGEQLEGYFEYNTDLFKETTIERMMANFLYIIEMVPNHINEPIGQLTLISEREFNEVVYHFNETACSYDKNETMHGLFSKQAAKYPKQIAITSGLEQMNYEALEQKSNQLAHLLVKNGVQPGSLVAVNMERSMDLIVSVLAIVKCGAAYAPFEPYLPDERLRKILSGLSVQHIITDKNNVDRLQRLDLEKIAYFFVVDDEGSLKGKIIGKNQINAEPISSVGVKVDPMSDAYVIFTSGSTGTPKGVVVKHRPVINLIEWVNKSFDIGPTDKELFVTSIGFDLSVYDIFGILAAGGTIRLVKSDDLSEPKHLLEILVNEKITLWDSAPQALQQLVPFFEQTNCEGNILKHVFLSGDWIPLTLPTEIKTYFKEAQVISLGGATEATVWSNYYTIDKIQREWVSIPYGKPIQNAKYYVLDKNLKPCPIGVKGDLYIGGSCLASEYINDETLTQSKFIPNPFVPGEKMYRTGDLSRWFVDGNLEFLGRSDFQVKIRGYRIELGEIESCLLQQDGIKESIVIDIEQNGTKCLCAYYTANNTIETGKLKSLLSKQLPDYMIPTYFMKIEKIPMTSNGKVDRKQLPKPKAETDLSICYEAPTNEVQKQIFDIWKEVLECSDFGINDNFFMIGGHSLRATVVTGRIHKLLNVDIPLKELFATPTINGLANYVINNREIGENVYEVIPKIPEASCYEVGPAQSYILSYHNDQRVTVFNEARVMEVEGKLDYAKVEKAFKQLIVRQELLRSRFIKADGRYVQEIFDAEEIEFKVKIVEETDPVKVRYLIDHFVRPFKINQAPLFEVEIIRISDDKNILMFNVDHTIFDAVSLTIFVKEFCQLYEGKYLQPLRIQYRDYSAWKIKRLMGPVNQKQEAYWNKIYATLSPDLDIPSDRERTPGMLYIGDDVSFNIDTETSSNLKEVAIQKGVSLYMVIMSNLKLLLHKYTGKTDISVGSAVAGRVNVELDNIIGVFINMVGIRTQILEDMSFADLLDDVKEKTLGAFENSEYPIASIINRFGGKKLYTVILLWENAETIKFNIEGLKFKELPLNYEASAYEIMISVKEISDGLSIRLSYAKNLFNIERIEAIRDYFINCIKDTSENLDIPLRNLQLRK
ncbi:surfactin family lipopeptide synthetase A [Ruminiclostridium sufflavum DSM 19573]|uniref:Surfactin family lipopeptide synthetase A n=1 Tax=Ruminiclostridium sufflavum DSM 19573 TaxID=1121337 RepID=A0A318XIJ5_9FIRM|nr:non-ribosomal peptide synthetase [Ruminiclostridium sufflavum]PYG84940.1 surfactin family lipopeptide synthetase A [Ruminiclostridium sufflavum DSM 19573]